MKKARVWFIWYAERNGQPAARWFDSDKKAAEFRDVLLAIVPVDLIPMVSDPVEYILATPSLIQEPCGDHSVMISNQGLVGELLSLAMSMRESVVSDSDTCCICGNDFSRHVSGCVIEKIERCLERHGVIERADQSQGTKVEHAPGRQGIQEVHRSAGSQDW